MAQSFSEMRLKLSSKSDEFFRLHLARTSLKTELFSVTQFLRQKLLMLPPRVELGSISKHHPSEAEFDTPSLKSLENFNWKKNYSGNFFSKDFQVLLHYFENIVEIGVKEFRWRFSPFQATIFCRFFQVKLETLSRENYTDFICIPRCRKRAAL